MPKQPKARFFLGVAAQQDGQRAKAATIWRDMLKDARPDSPWVGMVREALARVRRSASARRPGPSAEDVAAAEKMKPDDRAAMVRGMVERLAERLKHDGSDVEGWLRLVRAYTVLGDRDRALLPQLRMRAGRSATMPTSFVGLMNWSKSWGWKADDARLSHDPQAAAAGPDRRGPRRARPRGGARAVRARRTRSSSSIRRPTWSRRTVAPGSAHPARRAGEARQPGARRQSAGALRGDRRQQVGAGQLHRHPCRTCSAKGRAS